MAKYQSKHGIDVAEGAWRGWCPNFDHMKSDSDETLCKAAAGNAHMKLDGEKGQSKRG